MEGDGRQGETAFVLGTLVAHELLNAGHGALPELLYC